ncbi:MULTISPECIES: transglycosylase SLT domain-containing protein [Streptomyces]|uniref:Transglycosylase SLT domain-containing protein n=2 Tax=Streptomyces TaxID=1883 RepID=A0ABV9ITD3_9ACTN
MASERGPIKVGSGYVEIVPKVLSRDMAELRGKITSELGKIGVAASNEMTQAVSKGLASLPGEVQKQARKAKQAVESEAKDSAETIAELERFVTKQYGEQSKKRLQELREFYARYEGMTEEASATTRQALRETVRQEERAARDRVTAERDRVRQSERLARQQTTDQQRELQRQTQAAREAARQQAAAQRAAVQAQIAEIRAQATVQRQAIQQQISDQQRAMLQHRTSIQTLRRSIADANTAQASMFKRTQTGLKNMGTWFHELGTSITEAGNLLATKFIAPLAIAGTALTAVGVTNADKRLLGQLGLTSAGVSQSESAKQMSAIQKYAIDTPYSIDVMHEYQMRLIRSVAGADKDWYSKNPVTRTTAANKAADKTTDLIMSVGDSMARAGNLDPEMFRRAMYAVDMIMDMDRAPTRSLKQLAAASGMPASELAHLLGFENSQELWKVVGTPANQGSKTKKAGVSGTEIMNALLNYWNPSEYRGTQTGDGSLGFAEKMTSETISGRIQQMKERATFELGNMFIREGDNGKYEYTGLGRKLMGQQVPVYQRDENGELTVTGYRNQGGLLNQVQDVAKKYAPDVEKFLSEFLDAVSRFVSVIDQVIGWVKESGLDRLALAVGNFLVQWGPLIVAVGLVSKLLGKVLKVGGAALAPARAAGRGVLNARDGIQDIRSQRQARTAAQEAARGRGASDREVQQAGRDAYRAQRTENRGGDSRSNGRRMADAVFGRDGADTSAQRDAIRDLEDQITEARQESARLRDELRGVNNESMRQIAAALSGSSNNAVTGAASQAQQGLQQAQQQATRLNAATLSGLDQELTRTKEKAESLAKGLREAGTEAKTLDSRKLGSLRAQQVETTTKRVGDLKKGVSDAEKAVQALNGTTLTGLRNDFKETSSAADGTTGAVKDVSSAVERLKVKSLKALREQFKGVEDAARAAYQIVGQGTGAGSLAGRVGLLNGRSLSKVTRAVEGLRGGLKKARDEGDGLDGALDRIGKKSPGGSSSGGKKSKKARGGVAKASEPSYAGVMPGYQPWADKIPTLLTPGEAVLRPEVTHALGEERINAWNALAVRGKISRHARGTSGGGKFDLDQLKELIELQTITPIGTAMLKTMQLDGSSDPLGGSTQGGILRTGDVSAGFGGSIAADKFKGMYDWFTGDIYTFAKKVPSFIGQIAGILGGALSPVLGDYFWSDVWKGQGNIVDRGKDYLGDVFSTKTLSAVWDNLFGGVRDSLGAIWDTVTNPVDAFSGAFSDLGDIVSGSYNNLIGMIETVKEIKDSPLSYAGRVAEGFMDDAQAAMPNLTGLFDFDKGSKVNADIPDFGASMQTPTGKGVQRWAPIAAQALGMLGLPGTALNTVLGRIQLESGGNPVAVNRTDINWRNGTPSVGLMQVIGPTYKAYSGMFKDTGPFMYGTSTNALANIYAGLNYARNRYGSNWQSVLAGNKGYATGAASASPGLALVGEKGRELVMFGGGERVFDNRDTEGILNGRKYEIHVHEARTEPTPQAVMRALQTAEALYTTL